MNVTTILFLLLYNLYEYFDIKTIFISNVYEQLFKLYFNNTLHYSPCLPVPQVLQKSSGNNLSLCCFYVNTSCF